MLYDLCDLLQNEESLEETLTCQAYPALAQATHQDNAHASYLLSLMHIKGKGVPYTPDESMRLLKNAATLEHPEAYYSLGILYTYGWGVDRDTTAAALLYQKASDHAHPLAPLRLDHLNKKDSTLSSIEASLIQIMTREDQLMSLYTHQTKQASLSSRLTF